MMVVHLEFEIIIYFSLWGQNIEPNHAPTSVASHLSCNAQKNRYANIISCETLPTCALSTSSVTCLSI